MRYGCYKCKRVLEEEQTIAYAEPHYGWNWTEIAFYCEECYQKEVSK